jgi:hypothetical protein
VWLCVNRTDGLVRTYDSVAFGLLIRHVDRRFRVIDVEIVLQVRHEGRCSGEGIVSARVFTNKTKITQLTHLCCKPTQIALFEGKHKSRILFMPFVLLNVFLGTPRILTLGNCFFTLSINRLPLSRNVDGTIICRRRVRSSGKKREAHIGGVQDVDFGQSV